MTRANRASARRAASDSGRLSGVPGNGACPDPQVTPAAAARLASRRRLAAGTRRARRAAPRSAESRPEKQNAPSASVQWEKWRSAWMRRAPATGSVRADVARTRILKNGAGRGRGKAITLWADQP